MFGLPDEPHVELAFSTRFYDRWFQNAAKGDLSIEIDTLVPAAASYKFFFRFEKRENFPRQLLEFGWSYFCKEFVVSGKTTSPLLLLFISLSLSLSPLIPLFLRVIASYPHSTHDSLHPNTYPLATSSYI